MSRLFGALAGAIAILMTVGIAYGFLAYGPFSMRAEYERDSSGVLTPRNSYPPITEAEIARLPVPVQRYLRFAGVVGQVRVRNLRARMHGRFRGSPDAAWMPFAAEQYNTFGGSCCGGDSRFFYMTASRWLVPMQGYHRYAGGAATMRVRVAGAAQVMQMAGPEMTRAETVTLFNDVCVLAPGALVDADVVWEHVAPDRVTGAFTNAGITIRAELVFDADGRLVDFISEDRLKASEDGSTLAPSRWSTPLRGERTFGAVHLAAGGDARWHGGGEPFVYIELVLDDVAYNLTR